MGGFFRERPLTLAVLFLALLAGWFGVDKMLKSRNDRVMKAINEAEGGPGRKSSERVNRIRSLQYQDPDEALKRVRKAMSNPADTDEKKDLAKLLPEVLNNCFYDRMRKGQLEEAKSFMETLAAEAPDAFQNKSLRREWGNSLRQRWRDAANAGDDEQSTALFDEIVAGDYILGNTPFLEDYQQNRLARWVSAKETGDEEAALMHLLEAARVLVGANQNTKLVMTLQRSSWTGPEIYKFAEGLFENGSEELAVPFYQAARKKLDSGDMAWSDGERTLDYEARRRLAEKIEERTVHALVLIGDSVRDGKPLVITTLDARQIYEGAALNTLSEPLKVLPLMRKLHVEVAEFNAMCDALRRYKIERVADPGYLSREAVNEIYSVSHDARNAGNNILQRTAMTIWTTQLADSSFDPWLMIDSATAEKVAERFPDDNDRTNRREELVRMARNGDYTIPLPEVGLVRERLCEIFGRWGLLYIDGNPDEGFRMLRAAMRETTDAVLRDKIATALRKMIRSSQKKGDFDRLYVLSGFYVAEVGVSDLDDPFRREFKSCLQEAAKNFRKSSEMKHIFILSLLAESCPDERAGKDARERAIRLGFKAVSDSPLDSQTSETNPPSGMPGLSVINIDNSTDYHLLFFYDGPEVFFAHCNPRRRGSLVLKDGTYKVAVITTSSGVMPFRGEIELKSEVARSVYRIETETRSAETSGGTASMMFSSAMGDYSLLRVPDDANPLTIDPRTGAVSMPDR